MFRRCAIYLLLSSGLEVAAIPAPTGPEKTTTEGPTPITSVATSDGHPVTGVFTPTSISISGLAPPITKAMTITTTESNGETIAVAIAAGAGVVGAGALAAWLFKPAPGIPPAPTKPPSYPTSDQNMPQSTDMPMMTTTTTMEPPAACPFTKVDAKRDFQQIQLPAPWTATIPSQTVSSKIAKCTQQGSNNELLRGTDPGYIKALAEVFCKEDLSKDQRKTIGQNNLFGGRYKDSPLDGIRVLFNFKFGLKNDACPKNCVDAYNNMVDTCQYNSRVLYGGASLEQGCGTYDFMIDAEPLTEKTCKGPDINGIFLDYEYRDAALEDIKNFCKAQDGHVVKKGDESTWIKETAFTAVYADKCEGSGEYKITEKYCRQYLEQVVDECDTDTVLYKHGGTVTDIDNCGAFSFHPIGYDAFFCYPANKGILPTPGVTPITRKIAEDAIEQFCSREGEATTLYPDFKPTGFVQDTCVEKGYADCSYRFTEDGKRDKKGGIRVALNASFFNIPAGAYCGEKREYSITRDRCKRMLRKLISDEPGMCVGQDPNKLELGSFLESGDKGCVLWTMSAIKLPTYFLMVLGSYLLFRLGWGVFTFNDVPDAYKSLQAEITTATTELRAMKVDVD
ncbi:hypothetical protein MaudMau93_008048 [Microsporum audouinii]